MSNPALAQDQLERFRQLVLRDPALQEQLWQTIETEPFIALTVQLGRERGFDFTGEEVRAVMRASQLAWMLRWI